MVTSARIGWLAAAILFSSCVVLDDSRLYPCEADQSCRAGFICWADGYCHPSTADCPQTCSADETCVAGSCQARYQALALEAPNNGLLVGKSGAPVRVRLVAKEGNTIAEGARVRLRSFRMDGSPFDDTELVSGGGGVFSGVWPTPSSEERYKLEAELIEGSLKSPSVELEVDLTPPTLELQLPAVQRPAAEGGTTFTDVVSAYATAHRRDEVLKVKVTSSDPNLDTGTVSLELEGIADGGTTTATIPVTSWGRTDGGWEGVADVDLYQVPFHAFRGEMTLKVTGQDLAQNSGLAQVAVPVTRWKWSHVVQASASLSSAAVGQHGTLYFGSTQQLPGVVRALNADGTLKWTQTAGGLEAPPVVGRGDGGADVLFVGLNTQNGAELRVFDASGSLLPDQCLTPNGTIYGALALANTSYDGQDLQSALAVVSSGQNSNLLAIRPGSSSGFGLCRGGAVAAEGPFRAGLIVKGGEYFLTRGENTPWLRGYSFSSASGNFDPKAAPFPIDANAALGPLAATDGQLVGAGAVALGQAKLFAVDPTGQEQWTHFISMPGGGFGIGLPVVATGNRVWVGAADGLIRRVVKQGGEASANAQGWVKGAMVVGEGGLLYSVNAVGVLTAWGDDLVPRWSVSGLGNDVLASPNLDCARDASGAKVPGRPGVLYVTSNNGTVYAFVVDSRGIDTTAPWPKFQHDPRNTGNAATPLGEFACP